MNPAIDKQLQPNAPRDRFRGGLGTGLRTLLIVLPVATVVAVALPNAPRLNIFALCASFAYVAALYVLLRRGHYSLCTHGLVFGLIAFATFASAAYGSIRGTGTLVYIVALVCGGIFLGRRALIAAAALSMAAIAWLVHAQNSGLLPTPDYTARPLYALLYCIIIGVVAAMVYFWRDLLEEIVASLSDELRKRRRAEAALTRNQTRLASMFRGSPAALAITGFDDGRYREINDAYERIFAVRRDEVIGKTTTELGLWNDLADRERFLGEVREHGRVADFRVRMRRATGEVFEVMASAEMMQGEDGPELVSTVVDLSAEMRMRAELERSEQRFMSAFRQSPVAMTIVRLADRRYIEVNDANEGLLGYPREALVGRTGDEIGYWADDSERERYRKALREQGGVRAFDTRMVRRDGTPAEIRVWSTMIDMAGETCMLSTLVNVTEELAAQRRVAESRAKYAAVFDTVPDAIAVTRQHGAANFIELNAAWERLSGYSRERALGRSALELNIWADPTERARFLSRLERDGAAVNTPVRFVRADGREFDALVSAALFPVEGEPCVIWSWSDVSELRQAERLVAESERRYRSLFQAASDCIIVLDPEGRLLDMNDQGSRTLGYSREALLGESFTRVLDAHLLQRIYPRPADVAVERRSVRGEQELRAGDGSLRQVEFVASPLPDGNVLAIVRDVTARKRMEELLVNVGRGVSAEVGASFFHSLVLHLCTHLRADYAFIGEVLPGGTHVRTRAFVAECEPRPNFEYALEGSPCAKALSRRGTVAYPDHVADQFPADAGLKRLGVDGYIGTSLHATDGKPLGVLVVMSRRPIDEVPLWCSVLEIFASRAAAEIGRGRAERALQELNLNLEGKVAERTTELERANRELETFNYSVSHDLRAPLRAINGFAGIVRGEFSDALPADVLRYLARIESNAMHMSRLIDDLLEFSRTGRVSLAISEIDMRSVVDAVLRDMPDTRARIDIGSLPFSRGDATLVRQIWQNLIGNAIKFTRKAAEPRIEIGGERRDGRAVYWVRDNGAGFDPGQAAKLFGVFQRLHAAGEFEGSGVGLAIVQRIVQRHGGTVSAEGELDRGATFKFTLPAETAG